MLYTWALSRKSIKDSYLDCNKLISHYKHGYTTTVPSFISVYFCMIHDLYDFKSQTLFRV